MRSGLRWAVLLAGLLLSVGPAKADEPTRLALVIGVSDYDRNGRVDTSEAGVAIAQAAGYAPDLANATNDARLVAEALRGIGYSVQLVLDPDRAAMRAAIDAFGVRTQAAPANRHAVLYFAGHGVLLTGYSVLFPAGANIAAAANTPAVERSAALNAIAVKLQDIVVPLRRPRDDGLLLIVVDACRNNPWRESFDNDSTRAGLVKLSDQLVVVMNDHGFPEAVVAYSTNPLNAAEDGGDVNSAYAKALAQRLGTPEMTVFNMLDGVRRDVAAATNAHQIPTMNVSKLSRQRCLVSCPPGPTPTPAP